MVTEMVVEIVMEMVVTVVETTTTTSDMVMKSIKMMLEANRTTLDHHGRHPSVLKTKNAKT
jgi:hypothetical protein